MLLISKLMEAIMRYENLSLDQQSWVSEIQRDVTRNSDQFVYLPKVVCDTETGQVYSVREGFFFVMEIGGPIGSLPKKAIPYKNERPLRIKKLESYEIDRG